MAVWRTDGGGGAGRVAAGEVARRECARVRVWWCGEASRGAPRQSAAASHARRLVQLSLRYRCTLRRALATVQASPALTLSSVEVASTPRAAVSVLPRFHLEARD